MQKLLEVFRGIFEENICHGLVPLYIFLRLCDTKKNYLNDALYFDPNVFVFEFLFVGYWLQPNLKRKIENFWAKNDIPI